MTPQEFLKEIRKAFINAREVHVPQNLQSETLRRGRSHSISSEAEDLFACFMKEHLNNPRLIYLIDQPISYKANGKTKTQYPDLVICQRREDMNLKILYMFDFKTNMGWNRGGFGENCEKILNEFAKNLIKTKDAVYGKDGREKKRYTFSVSKNLRYDMVILSDVNIKADLFQKQLDQVNNNSKLKNTHIWLLSHEDINVYADREDFEPAEDFEKMLREVKNNIFSNME